MANLANIVELDFEEPEVFGVLESLELYNLVSGDVERLEAGKMIEACNSFKSVLINVELFNEQSVKVLNGVNVVGIE